MDQDITNFSMPESNNDTEIVPVENINLSPYSFNASPSESLSTAGIATSSSNNIIDFTSTEFCPSQQGPSEEEKKLSILFGSFSNGSVDEPSSNEVTNGNESKTDQSSDTLIDILTGRLDIEKQPTTHMNKVESSDVATINEETNTTEIKNVEMSDEVLIKENNNSHNLNKINEIPGASGAECSRNDGHIGQHVDLKRDMESLSVKTYKYKVKECKGCSNIYEEGNQDEGDKVVAIKQDPIECPVKDIEETVKKSNDENNVELRSKLTTEPEIEYVPVKSPQETSSKSNSRDPIIIHEDILCRPPSLSLDNEQSRPTVAQPSGSPTSTNGSDTIVLRTVSPYLQKAITENLKSYSMTDPTSEPPEFVPVQTFVPFKEPSTNNESGYLVITTGVINHSAPIYFLSDKTTLKDAFEGSIFSIVSHTQLPKISKHGKHMHIPDLVSPATSPTGLTTLKVPTGYVPSFQAAITLSGQTSSVQKSPVPTASVPVSLKPASGSQGLLSTVASPPTIAVPSTSPPEIASVPMTSSDSAPSTSKDTSTVLVKKIGRPSDGRSKNSSSSSHADDFVASCSKVPNNGGFNDDFQSVECSDLEKENEEDEFDCGCWCHKKSGRSKPSISRNVCTMVSCDDCGKPYKEGTTHKCAKKKGGKVEDKQFQCPECERSFSRKAHLNNHVRSHKSYMNRTTKCDICKERFGKGSEIQTHLEEHHPEILVSCSICAKKFTSQRLLEQHLSDHNQLTHDDYDKEEAFVMICPTCNSYFNTNYYEQVHVNECSKRQANDRTDYHNPSLIKFNKPVATRRKPWGDNNSISSGDADHYQNIEMLDEHLKTIYHSEELLGYTTDTEMSTRYRLKRRPDQFLSESDSDDDSVPRNPRKRAKFTPTAYRSIQIETSDDESSGSGSYDVGQRHEINVVSVENVSDVEGSIFVEEMEDELDQTNKELTMQRAEEMVKKIFGGELDE